MIERTDDRLVLSGAITFNDALEWRAHDVILSRYGKRAA